MKAQKGQICISTHDSDDCYECDDDTCYALRVGTPFVIDKVMTNGYLSVFGPEGKKKIYNEDYVVIDESKWKEINAAIKTREKYYELQEIINKTTQKGCVASFASAIGMKKELIKV